MRPTIEPTRQAPEALATRRSRLAALLAGRDVSAALITSPVNVSYLTGLASSNAALLVTHDGARVLATDARYAPAAHLLAEAAPDGLEVRVQRAVAGELVRIAAARGARRLGFEAHHLTVEDHGRLVAVASDLDLTPLGRAVEELRVVKDEGEITALRRACALTTQAFAEVVPTIGPGMTEREIARALECQMLRLGADKPAFDTIVAAGENGATPHHRPTDRPVALGDLVTMDFGACVAGYHADMTRTVALGAPAAWQRELYELVAHAQRAGCDAVRAGVALTAVDAAARDLIAAAGHRDDFTHGLGHGVGLEIHEAPTLGPGRPGTLRSGVPITIEPGVYLPGRGGVRIEDTLVVHDDAAEFLTTATKELIEL